MKINDILEMKNVEDVAQNFGRIQREFEDLREFAFNERPRDERQVVTENLCRAFELQCGRLKNWVGEPVDMIAWATRNVYELNLLARFVAVSSENTDHWLIQRTKDEIDLIDSVLNWTQNPVPTDQGASGAADVLQKRLQELNAIAQKYDVDVNEAKPIPVVKLAKEFNMEDEHRALFKLLSKYVHPSSWWVNAPKNHTQNNDARNLLWVLAQLYAQSALQTLGEYISHPDFVRAS